MNYRDYTSELSAAEADIELIKKAIAEGNRDNNYLQAYKDQLDFEIVGKRILAALHMQAKIDAQG